MGKKIHCLFNDAFKNAHLWSVRHGTEHVYNLLYSAMLHGSLNAQGNLRIGEVDVFAPVLPNNRTFDFAGTAKEPSAPSDKLAGHALFS